MPAKTEEYTLGAEEEYQIVDPETRELDARSERVLRRAQQALGEEEVAAEQFTSQIEVTTPVCSTLAEVRAEILRLRRTVMEAAEKEGNRIAAASTHPFSHWEEQRVTPKEHYRRIMEPHRQLAREQLTFGVHVHVGLSDREVTIHVMNRLRLWLASMLALSANSPFWLGEDSGYASYRTQVWGKLSLSEPQASFGSRAEYDELVRVLMATDSVTDASSIYSDVRLREHLGKIELRAADVCSRVDEAVMMAGLARALVRTCHEQAEREEPYPLARPELLRAAHWRASRHGLDQNLVDLGAERAVPAREMIEKLLAFTRPALEDAGDWEEVSTLVCETLECGNGANRQRRAYGRAGRLEDVVDMLIEDTTQGTNPA